MSRYGWSLGSREQLSPYGSTLGGAVPAVTDEDFSYITSQDLDAAGGYYPQSHSAAPPVPEDDILIIKHRGVTYPAHFPAYAIGDGKLRVLDVKERVGIMMDLSKRALRHIKLLYKGKQLKDPMAPVRDYGVKNNSELMAVLPEMGDGSNLSDEEMVIVDAPSKDKKSKKKSSKKKKSKKADGAGGSSNAASSPRDSASTFGSPRSPPIPTLHSPSSPVPAPTGPLKQIADLDAEFVEKWQPLCDEYIRAPPIDAKKRVDEHRKISETIMQQIILKTDGIDAEGRPDIRAKRKELVRKVQDALRSLDTAKGH